MITTGSTENLMYGRTSPLVGIGFAESAFVPAITIHDGSDQEIGRIEWPDGKFRFVGDAEESAQLFFECVLKPLVDKYIERRLREEQNT